MNARMNKQAPSLKKNNNLNRISSLTISYFLGFILVATVSSASGQYSGFEPVDNLTAFKKEFAVQSAKISSVSSNFTQEKVLIALTEKITSTGSFKFKRQNKVRIEYIKPFSYLLIMNGERMLVKDGNKETQLSVKSNKLFQQINQIMIDCIRGTILDNKALATKVFESHNCYLLEMTPVTKSLKLFFENIVLNVEKKDYSVNSIQMNEPGGDQTIITFTDKKINDPVQDAVFAF